MFKNFLRWHFSKNVFHTRDFVEERLFKNDMEIKKFTTLRFKKRSKLYSYLRKVKILETEKIYTTRTTRGFNTKFFRVNFDVVITDRFGTVLKTFKDLDNDFVSDYYKNGWVTFFLPVGFIEYYSLKEGDTFKTRRIILKNPL